jgi:hypothetical protein
MDVKSGIHMDVGGLSRGMKSSFYFHKVRIVAAGDSLDTHL